MSNFFKNIRICVTGGSGFLGSFLVEKLHDYGANIFIPRSKDYNLVERTQVNKLLMDSKPDIVIHLAAQVGGIGANLRNPGKFYFDNLMMGAHLFEECRLAKISKLVALGTICAYPKFTTTPFNENDIWNGFPEETNAPYGIAKKVMLIQSQSYRQQYNFNSCVIFPTNLYGPRDNFDLETCHVIPAMIRKFNEAKNCKNNKIVLWGDGSPTREFLYVEDAVEGILAATKRYNLSEPMNLGSGEEISIKNLATLIKDICGWNGEILWDTSKPNGQPRRCLDISRAEHLINFVAKTPLRDGIVKTVNYWQSLQG